MLLRDVFNFTLGVIFGVLNVATNACSPMDDSDVPYEHRAHLYDYILVGRVLGTLPDPRFDYGGGSDAYIAALKVYCSYKGERQPPIVNITEAGVIPGHCHASELIVGRDYIVLAMKTNGRLKILRELPLSKGVLQAFLRACGLNMQLPRASDDFPQDRCLNPAPPGDCVENPKATPSDSNNSPTENTYPKDSPSGTKIKLKSGNEIDGTKSPQKHAVACAESGSQRTMFTFLNSLITLISTFVLSSHL